MSAAISFLLDKHKRTYAIIFPSTAIFPGAYGSALQCLSQGILFVIFIS
jgi:hypothetical protein